MRDEKITVSPASTCKRECSSRANRVRPEARSPWVPAARIKTSFRGNALTSSGGIKRLSIGGISPSARAVSVCLLTDMPSRQTLRPCSRAIRNAALNRNALEEKVATTTRFGDRAIHSSSAASASRSIRECPSTSAPVESLSRRRTPWLPTSSKRARSKRCPSQGFDSILKSPVCTTVPTGVSRMSPVASAIEWWTAKRSTEMDPICSRLPAGLTRRSTPLSRCSARRSSMRAAA